MSTEMDTAIGRLDEAVEDLDLTDVEQRVVDWLKRWDAPTVYAIASVITKARKS